MNTPRFWTTRTTLNYLLIPLSVLYYFGYLFRRAFTVQQKLSVPLICIGNVTAGGGGKTPFALHLGAALKARNIPVFFVSRGYGGSAKGPLMVNPRKHTSQEVGDEPLLLAELLPTVVGKDRIRAAEYAIAKGAKLLIFDDGFQNKKIFKDISYLMVDGITNFGNGLLLPAGPMREPFVAALQRAHSVIVVNPMPDSFLPIPENKPLLFARTRVTGIAEKLRGQNIVAFCGIALPQKFRATLAELGARVIEFKAFADHAPYRYEMLHSLAERAAQEKAYMVTTRKDWVRLPPIYKEKVVVVDIELVFSNAGLFEAQLDFISGLV